MSKTKSSKRKTIRRIAGIVLAAVLMLSAVIVGILNRDAINLPAVIAAVLSLPSVAFFAAGVLGMVLMGIFAAKPDSADVRSNRIEQMTNTIAQAAFFVGILLLF